MPTINEIIFLRNEINSITNSRKYELPSDYIESVRYLPPELTSKPGYYDYSYTPYLKEIVDRMSPSSSARKIVVMKSSQMGFTVGVLESAVGYFIGCAPTSILYISADKELVEKAVETKVEQMIDSMGLRDKIFSQNKGGNNRKTGDRKAEKEFPGGFLHAIGSQSAGKLRAMSYRVIMLDELDGFPDTVGKEGDPVSLAVNRSNAFAEIRKILYLSTPTVQQTSKIEPLYLRGDQRNWYVPCMRCGEPIVMQWHIKNKNGKNAGIIFEVQGEDQILIPDSVRYKCQSCGGEIWEKEKTTFLSEGNWIATAKTKEKDFFSYWIDTTYSPPGMYSWINMTYDWLSCWDVEKGKVKNMENYRTFRNTKQGFSFEEQGESISYERVITHRRPYARNKINNKMAMEESGSNVLILTCAVDVQKASNELLVDIKAWCKGGISYTLDFRSLPAAEDVQTVDDKCWKDLENIIENEIWTADNKKQYRISTTVIDSGWATDTVYEFCKQYLGGVYAIKGEQYLPGGLMYRQMSKETRDRTGLDNAYTLNTTQLKRNVNKYLKSDWHTGQTQPNFYMNFPENLRDDFFKMFTAEYLAEKRDKRTGKFKGLEWRLIQGRANHAFDCAGYQLAAIEMIAEYQCINVLKLKARDWSKYWAWAIEQAKK